MGRGAMRTIRVLASIAVSVLATTAPAAAADERAWSGIYAGVTLGGRWADATWRTKALAADAAGTLGVRPSSDDVEGYDSAAPRVGALAGYDWQFARTWLTGLEGDFAWGDGREAHGGTPGTGLTAFGITDERFRVDRTTVRHLWDGRVRGRLGYLVTPAVLAYVTAGVAWQALEARAQCGGALPAWCLVGTSATRRSDRR